MSKKYNKRPSEVMDIKDSYLAFCFDEACDLIDSHRFYEEQKDGTFKEKWIKKPRWIDEGGKAKKPKNNSKLIELMKKQSKRFK